MTAPGVALAGAVALDVEPDASNFYPRLRAQVLPAADAVGRDIGRQMAAPMTERISGAIGEGVRDGSRGATARAARTGEDIGTAVARTLRARVEAGLKNLPEVELTADSSKVDRKVANVRRQLAELKDKRIGIDIEEDEALAKVQALRTQLSSLARDVEKVREAGGDIPLNLDAIKAGVEVTRLKDELTSFKREAARPTEVKIRVGAFEAELRTRVARAIAALPEIVLTADSSDTDRDLARIRAELAALQDKRIGIDIDAGAALAKVQALGAQLAVLEASDVDLDVRVDAGRAKAELVQVEALAVAVGAAEPTIDIDVDTGGAIASIAALVFTAAAARASIVGLAASGLLLAALIVPAAAASAAAVAAIGPAAIAGIAGIAVLGLAFFGVAKALAAVSSAQKQTGQSAATTAARQAGVANALAQVASAERSLANTRATADESRRRALVNVRNAEEAHTQAQVDALRVQQDLTRAREDARRSLEDLDGALRDIALDQRSALLDLSEARVRLDEVTTNPQATNIERQRAQLNYDQAARQIENLRVRRERLQAEQETATRRGVEGSEQVVAAQGRIAAAQDKVTAAAEALGEARLAQAAQERQAAFSVEQATAGVASAQRSLAQAYTTAGDAGVASANKAGEAMAALSPQGRAFVAFILSLKGQLRGVTQAAEAGFLPGLQAGITAFLPMMPQVVTFVSKLATALGGLAQRAGAALAAPFWQNFFRMLGDFAGPAFVTFGQIMGSLAEGFGSLILAFMPLSQEMGTGLAGMAAGFAAWAASLSTSKGFQEFVDYVKENGPRLLTLLGDVLEVAINLGVGLAPVAKIVMDVAGAMFAWLASMDPGQLLLVAGAIGAVIAVLGFAAGGPILLIAAGVALVVAALVGSYQHFEGFRTVVDTVWKAVAAGAVWLWDVVLKPTFAFLAAAFAAVGAAAMWLWREVLEPAFTAIGAVVMFVWETVLQPIFAGIAWVIQNVVIPVVLFLWRNVIEPAWQGIQLAISIAWAVIQVVFGLIQIAVKILSAVFDVFYRLVIKPIWDGISATISFVWERGIKPVLSVFGEFISEHVAPAFKRGVEAVKSAWEGIREAAKVPIRFVVEEVLNGGLLAGYNFLAKTFKVEPSNVRIPLPPGFATGGFVSGPGGPTEDAILARLSAGEYVIPAKVVAALGIDFFDQLVGRRGVPGRRPGDGSEGIAIPAFAEGGFVGFLKSAWNNLKDPLGYLREQANAMFGRIPGGAWVRDTVAGVARKALDGVIGYARQATTNTVGDGGYLGPVSADVAAVQNWIRAQHGKPYVWAAAGPGGYDCSGMVGAAYNMLHGKPPHSRIFSTHTQARFFPRPGIGGTLTAGWAAAGQRGGGRVGHTAAQLVGLPFESRGGDGVVVGRGATPVTSFAHVGHFDRGGYLMPGITIARNDTGAPEPVLTGSQWDALLQGRQQQGSPSVSYKYEIHTAATTLDDRQLQALVDRQEARARVGRPG